MTIIILLVIISILLYFHFIHISRIKEICENEKALILQKVFSGFYDFEFDILIDPKFFGKAYEVECVHRIFYTVIGTLPPINNEKDGYYKVSFGMALIEKNTEEHIMGYGGVQSKIQINNSDSVEDINKKIEFEANNFYCYRMDYAGRHSGKDENESIREYFYIKNKDIMKL